MTTKSPFCIFISHIHEEAPVAKELKQWLEACFPGHVAAFVSSDYEDIPLGRKWLAEIESAIDSSRLAISLISETSLNRMWIHLEAGWALGRKIDVLPICYGGTRAANLPRPYSDFNGVDVEADDFAGRLLSALKIRLGLSHSQPRSMIEAFNHDARAAVAALDRTERAAPSMPAKPTGFQPDETELSILRLLLEDADQNDPMPAGEIPSRLSLSPATAEHHLNRLDDANLVSMSLIRRQGEHSEFYSLSDKGIAFLIARGELK